ncbi:MAG: Dipeptide transport system permease protein DppC [Devosia sp.]|uniref:ABC transporter permease n=1 Tax=Devosia sp. TaxID=1871048 RepID=UPI00260EC7C6|nr:ABC transporter permease [Devosia sp.]MDB5542016.1 Dipeptide transport system permease protein DppC [Devosia sp.]
MSIVPAEASPRRTLPRWLLAGNWSLRLGVVGFALIVLAAIFAPLVSSFDPVALDLRNALKAPSLVHPMGTDHLGRDVFSRVIYGARVDLQIGAIGVALPLILGSVIGLAAGYLGGWVDAVVGRIVDIIIAFPFLVLVIAIVAMLGPGLINLYIALTAISWVLYTRIVRAEALALKKREYVLAARNLGFGHLRIMFRHILPNAIAPAFVFAMSDFALDVQVGATLSFFGLGAQPPTPEWGLMIAETRSMMLTAPWVVVGPGLAIVVVSLVVSLIGDGLADLVRGIDD